TMEMVQCFRVTRYGPTLCARQMYFAFGASSHQVLDSIMRRFALVQDRVHLLGYRHLDFVLAGKLEGGVGRVNAFCDHAVHAGDDLRQSAPAPEFDSHASIPGKSARACEDKIAQPGQS